MLSPSLILILAVALAYLAAHVAFDWLARKFMLVSGAEYLLLGILLGPQVSGVLSADTMAGFAPLITLALGWIGAIVGTQFYLPGLVRIPAAMYRLAFIEAIATAFLVGGVTAGAIAWLWRAPLSSAAVPAAALGAIAAVSAPAGIEVVTRRIGGLREPIVRQLQVATAIDALVGIVAMGLLFCLQHPATNSVARPITPTEWAVITIAIGVVGGALFHLFLGREIDTDRLFISMGGAIILVSGAAAYLHLSPVLTSMIVGAVLINTSRGRDQIVKTLSNSERPFYFVLLVFAGASWRPSASGWWWIPVLLFLLTRVAGKIGSARLGARVNGALPVLGNDWGRALIGQGGLALALALDYTRFEGATLPNIVFSAAIASVILTDVTSARLIHSVMSRLLPHGPIRRRITSAASGQTSTAEPSSNGMAPGAAAPTDAPLRESAQQTPSTPSRAERR
jgi:Kef-type K+ transport system membrane component KefB